MLAMGADSADGILDGLAPSSIDLGEEVNKNASEIAASVTAGRLDFDLVGGSCSLAADVLASSCEFDVMDDFLEDQGFCQNADDEDEYSECLEELADEKEDNIDWFAQDVDGNVWYCGEIAENFEMFAGDDREERELVDIEGSWKHGRDTAEAGILMPFEPVVGGLEKLFGEAENAMEILSLEGDTSTPGASCNGMCLVTPDFSPIDPDGEENKYYLSGAGIILEVDLETGARVELQSFTPGTP